jgi:UDP-N-acetylglucosamine acyltransferase
MTAVHQFVRIGAHSFTGIGTRLLQDLPPYVTVSGEAAKPYGVNSEGLKRRGFTPETINAIKRAYRTLYRAGLSLEDAKRELEQQAAQCPEVGAMVEFLARCERGIVR